MSLVRLTKALLQTKPSAYIVQLGTNIERYEALKADYRKASDYVLSQMSHKAQVFLLLTALQYEDYRFAVQLTKQFAYDKMETDGAKIALGRLYSGLDIDFRCITAYLPLFNEHKLTRSLDLEKLFNALLNMAQHVDCDRVLTFALEKFPDQLDWKLIALHYQVSIRHLYPKNNDFIIGNIRYLYPRCQTAIEYAYLATATFAAGLMNETYKLYNLALEKVDTNNKIVVGVERTFNSSGCLETMNEIIDLLASIDKQSFPVFGSLLGLVRDGKLMDYDKDADIGIFVKNYQELYEMVHFICQQEHLIAPSMVKNPKESHLWNVAIFDRKRNTAVDIFVFHHLDGMDCAGIYSPASILKWLFKPIHLVQQELAGKVYWIPDNADAHLTEIYGDWRTPVKVWDSVIDCPNLAKDSAPIVINFGLQRLYRAIKDKNLKKIDNYYQGLLRWGHIFSDKAKENLLLIREQLAKETKADE